MTELFQPDLVIHHDADTDGRCSAWLMRRYVCPDAIFFGMDYGDTLHVDVRGRWVAIWKALPDGTHQYSLRSQINGGGPLAVDVNEVAKGYGGGGHAAAAGFRITGGKL